MANYGYALGAIRSSLRPSPIVGALRQQHPRQGLGNGLGLLENRHLGGEHMHSLPPGPAPEPLGHPDHAPMPGPGYPSHPDHAPMPGPPNPLGSSPLVNALLPHFQRTRPPRPNRGMGAHNPFAGHQFGGQQLA